MFSHKLKLNNKIPLFVVTHDHLYPSSGVLRVTGKDVAINFLQCLQKVGLGTLYDGSKPYFEFFDIEDTENLIP